MDTNEHYQLTCSVYSLLSACLREYKLFNAEASNGAIRDDGPQFWLPFPSPPSRRLPAFRDVSALCRCADLRLFIAL